MMGIGTPAEILGGGRASLEGSQTLGFMQMLSTSFWCPGHPNTAFLYRNTNGYW